LKVISVVTIPILMYAPNANHASAMVSAVYNFEVRSAPADSSFLVV